MKNVVNIVVGERFGLPAAFCQVEVTHASFDEFEASIKSFYPNCERVTIALQSNLEFEYDADTYHDLRDGEILVAAFTGRSIESIVVVKGKYADGSCPAYMQAFPVVHHSFEQMKQFILEKNPECTLDKLEIPSSRTTMQLQAYSYKDLTANGFITASVTRKGKCAMGSRYSTIDAFNANVLNFNRSKKFIRRI
jgi:hypothetical protein